METIFEMKKRHKAERLELLRTAIKATRNVADTAKLIKMDRGAIYRELREAGTSWKEILLEQDRETEKGAT